MKNIFPRKGIFRMTQIKRKENYSLFNDTINI